MLMRKNLFISLLIVIAVSLTYCKKSDRDLIFEDDFQDSLTWNTLLYPFAGSGSGSSASATFTSEGLNMSANQVNENSSASIRKDIDVTVDDDFKSLCLVLKNYTFYSSTHGDGTMTLNLGNVIISFSLESYQGSYDEVIFEFKKGRMKMFADGKELDEIEYSYSKTEGSIWDFVYYDISFAIEAGGADNYHWSRLSLASIKLYVD
ncbi:MAG: hypothetical protein ACJAVH_001995 [Bacteroidia bacterium]|jgi:hypothetical protein